MDRPPSMRRIVTVERCQECLQLEYAPKDPEHLGLVLLGHMSYLTFTPGQSRPTRKASEMTGTIDFWTELQEATTELGINIDQMGHVPYVKIADLTPSPEERALFIFRLKELSDRLRHAIDEANVDKSLALSGYNVDGPEATP